MLFKLLVVISVRIINLGVTNFVLDFEFKALARVSSYDRSVFSYLRDAS